MLMHMIRKHSKDQKTDWPKHLPELEHAYNSMRLAITRYSPHYLMFRCWPCLPIDFYFPTIRGMEKHWHVDYYIARLCEWMQETFKEAKEQSMAEAGRQKQNYDGKANAILLEPLKLTSSHCSCGGHYPLYGHESWAGRVHHHHPRGTNSR